MKKIIIIIFLLFPTISFSVEMKEIIERLTRLEERQEYILKRLEESQRHILREIDKRFEAIDKRFEAIDKRFEAIDKRFEAIDKRFEEVNQRFGQLIHIFIGIVAAFAAIVAVTISFAIWDRRTALRPAVQRTAAIEEELERVKRALREMAEKDKNVYEALKHAHLL